MLAAEENYKKGGRVGGGGGRIKMCLIYRNGIFYFQFLINGYRFKYYKIGLKSIDSFA